MLSKLRSIEEAEIDAIFAPWDQCREPGVAVGIAQGGRPTYRRAFGLANVEIPMTLTPSTRMRIGSTTKQFTSLSWLLLCEEGRCGLDDPLGRHLPELHRIAHGVTMRQLMGHISGLPDALDMIWQFNAVSRKIGCDEVVALYEAIDWVDAEPGSVWKYNNGAYALLSAAIERVSGTSFAEFLNSRIFEPIGMTDSALRVWDSECFANSAAPHICQPSGFERFLRGAPSAGSGGIVSTIDDMLRWMAQLDKPVVGNAESWAELKRPLTLTNGRYTGYALGLVQGEHRGFETLSHAGGVIGGSAQMLKFPAQELDIVIIVNRSDVSALTLANRVADHLLAAGSDMPMARQHSEGLFRSPRTGRIVRLHHARDTQLASIDGVDWPMLSDDRGQLVLAPPWTYIRQSIQLAGDPARPSSLIFSDFGNVDHLKPLPSCGESARGLSGRYRAAVLRTDATITDDGNWLKTQGPFGRADYALSGLGPGIWSAQSMQAGATDALLTISGTGWAFTTGRNRVIGFVPVA